MMLFDRDRFSNQPGFSISAGPTLTLLAATTIHVVTPRVPPWIPVHTTPMRESTWSVATATCALQYATTP